MSQSSVSLAERAHQQHLGQLDVQKTSSRFQHLLDQLAACHQQELQSLANRSQSDACEGIPCFQEGRENFASLDEEPRSPRSPASPKKQSSETWDPANGKQSEAIVPSTMRRRSVVEHIDDMGVLKFSLRGLWDEELLAQEGTLSRKDKSTFAGGERYQDYSDADSIDSVTHYAGPRSMYIAHPSSKLRMLWDAIGALLIFYDTVVVPMGVFNHPEYVEFRVLDFIGMFFWTLNVLASLTVGHYSKGSLVMSFKLILKNYLKTWFLMDLLTVVPDWVLLLAFHQSSAAPGRMLRLVRFARFTKLFRLWKLNKIVDAITDYLDSEYSSICFNVAKLLVLLLLLSHFIACIWFASSLVYTGADGKTWVEVHGLTLDKTDWSYQYLTALHWSLTQFTPASMHIQPQNSLERILAIAVLLFGLVCFSYILGSITSSIRDLRELAQQRTKDLWTLRRFLKQHKVSVKLCVRIQKYVEYVYDAGKKKLSLDSVAALKLLSSQLSEELLCAINLPVIEVHPLFDFLNQNFRIVTSRLAKEAVVERQMAKGDILFLEDHLAAGAYFVSRGRVQYTRMNSHQQWQTEYVDQFEDWISEHILWTPSWYHVGSSQAHSQAEILLIKPTELEEALASAKPVARLVGTYGRNFMRWIEQNPTDLNDVIQGDMMGEYIRSLIPQDGDANPGRPMAKPTRRRRGSLLSLRRVVPSF